MYDFLHVSYCLMLVEMFVEWYADCYAISLVVKDVLIGLSDIYILRPISLLLRIHEYISWIIARWLNIDYYRTIN
jgi:hypothetical protein